MTLSRIRRCVAAVAVTVLAGVFAATPADAAIPTYSYGVSPNIQQPVEQETDYPWPADQSQWVINPLFATPCAWDVDDSWSQHALGTLRSGESLTVHECMIASPSSFYRTINGLTAWWFQETGYLGTRTQALIPDLAVSVCYPQGRCFVPHAVYDAANKVYVYSTCTHAKYNADDPTLQPIPGSQGGIGLVQDITVTIANPTSHNARNLFSDVSAVGTPQLGVGASGCPPSSGSYTPDYPFNYFVS